MKQGQTLTDLAQHLHAVRATAKDYVASLPKLQLDTDGLTSGLRLKVDGIGDFGLTEHAHSQLASKLQIPKAYYDRLAVDAPNLLCDNVNEWLVRSEDKSLLRTIQNGSKKVRAILSERYRPLDNYDLFEAIAPSLTDTGMQIVSCNVDDTKFYLKVVTERIRSEVRVGDVVQAGCCISNSEVGSGALAVEPLVFRCACLNGMIRNDSRMKRHHVGKGLSDFDDGAKEYFRDETRVANDAAFWLKVRDTVAHAFDEQAFVRSVELMRNATERALPGDPFEVMEVVSNRFNLREAESKGVIAHLLSGNDLTQYGLVNALTRYSQDVDDYQRATEFERLGGAVLELPRTDWNSLVSA